MQDRKIEVLLTPAKNFSGLSEDERLEFARLTIKAGYRVMLERRRPSGKTTGLFEYYAILDRPREG